MDKKAMKTGTGIFLSVLVIAVVVVLVVFLKPAQLSAVGGSNPTTGQPTNSIITSSTALTFSAVDKGNAGTAVGTTNQIRVNTAPYTTGITTASQGDSLKVLMVNNTGYHNGYVEHVVAGKTTDSVVGQLNKNASITITVFNQNNNVMDTTNYNQTVATGGSYTLAVAVDGQDKASTQDMVCILDESATSKTDKVQLTGLGAVSAGTAVPKWYSLQGATSAVWVYNVAPISGAGRNTGSIIVQSASGQSLAGTSLKLTCATKEYFLDSYTGEVAYDVADSQGTAKYMASYTKTLYFN